MIASVRGRVLATGPGWLVSEVGGVGLRIDVPRHTVAHAGDELSLHTSLVVREDALTLYGFTDSDELEMFGHLITVSGVGPRSALGILSEMRPVEIARAVAADDAKPFRKVSGVGPKTSKLIVLSLAGKIDPLAFAATDDAGGKSAATDTSNGTIAAVVEQGLVGLGWSEGVAEQAVQDAQLAGAPEDQAGLLRAALALLQTTGGRGGAR